MKLRLFLIFLLISGFTPLARSQYSGQLRIDAVVLPVSVLDKHGVAVPKLKVKDFSLRVDGHPVPIHDFGPEADLPISLAFILDTSGSMSGRKMRACRHLIEAFLEERRQEDELALWTFSDTRVLERFPFGMSWYLLPRVLEGLKPWSTTALYDVIRRVPDIVGDARHPRKAAILLTDGVDNASAMTADEARELAEKLKTPVYVLGVEPPPAPEGNSGSSYEDILRLIAEASGGSYRRVPRLEEMPTITRRLIRELSSRYILSFETSGLGERRWRPLEIRVRGYHAITRKGYVGTLP